MIAEILRRCEFNCCGLYSVSFLRVIYILIGDVRTAADKKPGPFELQTFFFVFTTASSKTKITVVFSIVCKRRNV